MKKRRKNFNFRIPTIKVQIVDPGGEMKNRARHYMKAARDLTPLIIRQEMGPGEASVLIACYTEAEMAGATDIHSMSEQEIMDTWRRLISLWKLGLFTPGSKYPYTLEQTLAVIEEDGIEGE